MKLITFLGTTNYKPTIYSYQNQESIVTPFVQVALTKFTDISEALVLVTADSKEKNWKNLQEQMTIPCKCVEIAEEGFEELFLVLKEAINPFETLIIDITHAFRYLPLGALPMISYLKLVKNIQVEAIYYGKLIGDLSNIPCKGEIIDLSYILEIQRWISAAESFLTYGQIDQMVVLLNEVTKKAFTSENASRPNKLSQLRNSLDALNDSRQLNQLNDLATEAEKAYSLLTDESLIDETATEAQLLLPLIGLLVKDVKVFKNVDSISDNHLNLAKWYLDHKDPASATLATKEAFITLIMTHNNLENEIYDYKRREEIGKEVNRLEIAHPLRKIDSCLREIRNNIAHCGMRTQNIKNTTVNQKLRNIFRDIENLDLEYWQIPLKKESAISREEQRQ